jgi:hypothetical protein
MMSGRIQEERRGLWALLFGRTDEPAPPGRVSRARAAAASVLGRSPRRAQAAKVAVKAIHTFIFAGMASAVVHVLYSGLAGRVTKLTTVSVVLVIGETVVLLGNKGRCPLTDVVEDLGSEHGSVSDIFLPQWFARRIPEIFGSMFAVGLVAIGVRMWRG